MRAGRLLLLHRGRARRHRLHHQPHRRRPLWLLLALISAGAIAIRYFFIQRHFGRIRHELLFVGALLIFGATAIASMKPKDRVEVSGEVPFATAQGIIQKHCVMCHAATPTHAGFSAPPLGATFDTPARSGPTHQK